MVVVVVVASILGCCTIQFVRSILVVFPSLHNVCFIFYSFCYSCRSLDVFLSKALFSSSFLAHHSSPFIHFGGFCAWVFVSTRESTTNDHCMANLFFILTNFDILVSAVTK